MSQKAALPKETATIPAIETRPTATGLEVDLSGGWRTQNLRVIGVHVWHQLQHIAAQPVSRWDLTGIAEMDHLGALLIWRAWGHQLPESVRLAPGHAEIFARLAKTHPRPVPLLEKTGLLEGVRSVGLGVLRGADFVFSLIELLGQLLLDLFDSVRHPARWPGLELSAGIYRVGAQALGITALVGFLIGVVLSYLTADQLRPFGADVYIVNLLGISTVRELGPLLAAILVAGRSGSAITAQLGVMRLNEELDALTVLGIRYSQRLILPRVLALGIAVPLVVLWTNAMILFGAMVAARLKLGLSIHFFVTTLPNVIQLANYWIGVGKGVVFGLVIGMVASLYGLRIQPNTESLGAGTTSSVVVSITAVILVDAVFAIVLSLLRI